MTTATEARSGKGHRDENFPVASKLIAPRHRAPILAFYRFVRAADDVADHETLSPEEKIRLLDRLEAALTGAGEPDPEAEPLKRELAARHLSPKHAQDLLAAFRLDARKARYRDWDDLVRYCSLSAMPVGRFVLDVHGESQTTWPASDALCASLQVINHLQDCAEDYRRLDRVYLPQDVLDRHGANVTDLAAPAASPRLLATIRDVNESSAALLRESAVFPRMIADRRLALEVSVIHTLADALTGKLRRYDPLSERVHATKVEALAAAGLGVLKGLFGRTRGRAAASAAKAAR